MKEPEDEAQKLPLQPPYYDMAATEPAPNAEKMVRTEAVRRLGLPLSPHLIFPRACKVDLLWTTTPMLADGLWAL